MIRFKTVVFDNVLPFSRITNQKGLLRISKIPGKINYFETGVYVYASSLYKWLKEHFTDKELEI